MLAGVALWDVLQLLRVPSQHASGRQRGASYVKVVGADSQAAVFAVAEVDPSFTRRTIILADQRDGRSLDDTEGPWRLIAPDDIRHARWIRRVTAVYLLYAGP